MELSNKLVNALNLIIKELNSKLSESPEGYTLSSGLIVRIVHKHWPDNSTDTQNNLTELVLGYFNEI